MVTWGASGDRLDAAAQVLCLPLCPRPPLLGYAVGLFVHHLPG